MVEINKKSTLIKSYGGDGDTTIASPSKMKNSTSNFKTPNKKGAMDSAFEFTTMHKTDENLEQALT